MYSKPCNGVFVFGSVLSSNRWDTIDVCKRKYDPVKWQNGNTLHQVCITWLDSKFVAFRDTLHRVPLIFRFIMLSIMLVLCYVTQGMSDRWQYSPPRLELYSHTARTGHDSNWVVLFQYHYRVRENTEAYRRHSPYGVQLVLL